MIRIEAALSQKKISGLLLMCFENERPLVGTLGYLNWCLNGHFSDLMKSQVLTGEAGECVYTPLKFNDDTYHFIIVGGGWSGDANEDKIRENSLVLAMKKAEQLGLENVGIVASDWNLEVESMKPVLEARKICILN